MHVKFNSVHRSTLLDERSVWMLFSLIRSIRVKFKVPLQLHPILRCGRGLFISLRMVAQALSSTACFLLQRSLVSGVWRFAWTLRFPSAWVLHTFSLLSLSFLFGKMNVERNASPDVAEELWATRLALISSFCLVLLGVEGRCLAVIWHSLEWWVRLNFSFPMLILPNISSEGVNIGSYSDSPSHTSIVVCESSCDECSPS